MNWPSLNWQLNTGTETLALAALSAVILTGALLSWGRDRLRRWWRRR